MATILQAAKWMQEGKIVHRRAWGTSPVCLHANSILAKIQDDLDRESAMTTVELLADDWEIYPFIKV